MLGRGASAPDAFSAHVHASATTAATRQVATVGGHSLCAIVREPRRETFNRLTSRPGPDEFVNISTKQIPIVNPLPMAEATLCAR